MKTLDRCVCGEPSVTTVSAANGEWPRDRCEECARYEMAVDKGWVADPPLPETEDE